MTSQRRMTSLLIMLSVSIVLTVNGQKNDQTIVPGAKGSGVVEAVLNRIESVCIFDEDKLFMRRLAWVETYDGLDVDAFREGYYGGIWKVDKAMFDVTQQTAVLSFLKTSIDIIRTSFGVDWKLVLWNDLTKPLHSALAARLYLQYQTRAGVVVPRPIDGQATYWRSYYRPAGDVNYFKTTAEKLEQGCENGNGADIIFVLDESGSIGASNFILIKNFVNQTVAAFDIGLGDSQTRVGVAKFGTTVAPVFELKTYSTKAQVSSAVMGMTYTGGGTNTKAAIDRMIDVGFTTTNGVRDKSRFPRVGIVVTDGVSDSTTLTAAAAKRAHDADITMIAVGVGTGINMNELKAIASDPYCKHMILLAGFTEFSSLKDAIQQRTCEAATPIVPGSNSSTGGRLPPDGEQNCKIKLPADGATIRLETEGGRTTFYIAKATYPSPDYYEQMIESVPGRPGVMFIPSNSDNNMYCSIKGDNRTETNITIGCKPGDQDHCRSHPCLNNGVCVDTGTSYRCECPPGVVGNNCENVTDPCISNPCIEGDCHNKDDASSGKVFECVCKPGFGGTYCNLPVDECSSNPCGEHADCKPIHSGYECCCHIGWTGTGCNERVDECHSNPCVHGDCVDGDRKYTCYCDEGYTGENCEIDIDECASDPCVNGDCIDHVNRFQCSCLPGWTGTHCEEDIDECESDPCIHGDCVNGQNRFQCLCRPGYTGKHCETDIDDCTPNPCQHGQCEDRVNDYLCHCPPGWTGKDCQTDIDECESAPCHHGLCDDKLNGYECICLPGYTGSTCLEEINECESDPCENGAECDDRVNGYDCRCKPGYTGDHCQTDIDECDSNPCMHGVCTDHVNGYTCKCDLGYTGSDCSSKIDECASNPCLHGDCQDNIGHYICLCHPGWTGKNCDEDIDDCSPNHCVHGNCTDLVNAYLCTCEAGWSGKDCDIDIDECSSSPCFYGDCVDGINRYDCVCHPGYYGDQCEHETNECLSNPCVHGECRDQINKFECICPPGWSGPHCDTDIDECASNPCLHGDCDDRENGYVCHCNPAWEGTHCDCVVNNCDPNPCLMGSCTNDIGSFTCSCIRGYTGQFCDINPAGVKRSLLRRKLEQPNNQQIGRKSPNTPATLPSNPQRTTHGRIKIGSYIFDPVQPDQKYPPEKKSNDNYKPYVRRGHIFDDYRREIPSHLNLRGNEESLLSPLFDPSLPAYYPDIKNDNPARRFYDPWITSRSENVQSSNRRNMGDPEKSSLFDSSLPAYYPDNEPKEQSKLFDVDLPAYYPDNPGGQDQELNPGPSDYDPELRIHLPAEEKPQAEIREIADVRSGVLFDSDLPAYYPDSVDTGNTEQGAELSVYNPELLIHLPAEEDQGQEEDQEEGQDQGQEVQGQDAGQGEVPDIGTMSEPGGSGVSGGETSSSEEGWSEDESAAWKDILRRLKALSTRLGSSKRDLDNEGVELMDDGEVYPIPEIPTSADPSSTYNCQDHVPCTTENIESGHEYFAHDNRHKFIQCTPWGDCIELSCPSGLVWNTKDLICDQP